MIASGVIIPFLLIVYLCNCWCADSEGVLNSVLCLPKVVCVLEGFKITTLVCVCCNQGVLIA